MSVCTHSQASSNIHRKGSQSNICESQSLQSLITCPQHHDFKLVIEKKGAQPETVHLYALTMQEKAAWISDISQVSLCRHLIRRLYRVIALIFTNND